MTQLTPVQISAMAWLPSDGSWSKQPPSDFKDTLLALPDELVEMSFGGSDFVYRLTDAGLIALRTAST